MWDSRYAEPEWAYGTEPNDFLVEVADRLPPGPILCLAEGQGRNAVWLAGRGHDVTAVDASLVGLERAAALAEARRVDLQTVHADLEDYDLGHASWAGIVAIWCHLPPALRQKVLQGVVRALRPGGAFVLEAYTPAQLQHNTGGPRSLDLLYTRAELEAELQGLDLEILREVTREIHEGRYHDGPSATVQVLARKPR